MSKNKVTKEELEDFLRAVDQDFPVPLSQKSDLSVLAEKFVERADIVLERVDGEIAGAVIGYITNSYSEISFITAVAVMSPYRGRGIAKSLLGRYVDAVKKAGKFRAIDIYTQPTNVAALKVYRGFGFVDYKMENEPRPNDVHLIYYL